MKIFGSCHGLMLQPTRRKLKVKPDCPAGHKPRGQERQRRGAAGPRRVVESRPQNQDPAGARAQGGGRQPVQPALCNAD